MVERTRILNIDVMRITQQQLLRQLNSGVLFTPNIDHWVKLQHDPELRKAYAAADWVVCDSRIVYFLSRWLEHPLPQAIPGSTFFRSYCDCHATDPDCKIFILGGEPGVAERARDNINRRIGREIVVGTYSPAMHFEHEPAANDAIIRQISQSGANVLAVCLGAPKQEIWIHRHRHRLPGIRVFMALGATVDFEAGKIKRAPALWRRAGMEWLYRFLQEPRRLFRRYFISDPRFFIYFLRFHFLHRPVT